MKKIFTNFCLNKTEKCLAAWFLAALILIGTVLTFFGGTVRVSAETCPESRTDEEALSGSQSDEQVQEALEKVLTFYAGSASHDDLQRWLSGPLSADPENGALWCALALRRYDETLDFTTFSESLATFLKEHKIAAATTRELAALVLIAGGRADVPFVGGTVADAIGKQGVVSLSYGLMLLTNLGDFAGETQADVISRLAAAEIPGGGFAIMGNTADTDVTAMVLQALAPYRDTDETAAGLIVRGLSFLEKSQLESGGFQSFGAENAESTAEVLLTLTALGINPEAFGENSPETPDGPEDGAGAQEAGRNGLLEVLLSYQLPDGSFSHTAGGGSNGPATYECFLALTAYRNFREAQASGNAGTSPFVFRAPGDEPLPVEPSESGSDDPGENPSESGSGDKPGEDPSKSGKTGEGFDFERFFGGYKGIVMLGVVILAAVLCAVLLLLKKRSGKNFAAVFAGALLVIFAVGVTNCEKPEDYYGSVTAKEHPVGTVTLTVRCDALVGLPDGVEDPVIIPQKAYEIEAGDTAYDMLTEAAKAAGIPVEHSGSKTDRSLYIIGINGIYEFGYGDLSGWVYRVNGERPSMGCGNYELKDGDSVEFLYSLELGEDIR